LETISLPAEEEEKENWLEEVEGEGKEVGVEGPLTTVHLLEQCHL
jgi:hypothetical protein